MTELKQSGGLLCPTCMARDFLIALNTTHLLFCARLVGLADGGLVSSLHLQPAGAWPTGGAQKRGVKGISKRFTFCIKNPDENLVLYTYFVS